MVIYSRTGFLKRKELEYWHVWQPMGYTVQDCDRDCVRYLTDTFQCWVSKATLAVHVVNNISYNNDSIFDTVLIIKYFWCRTNKCS